MFRRGGGREVLAVSLLPRGGISGAQNYSILTYASRRSYGKASINLEVKNCSRASDERCAAALFKMRP